MSSQSHSDVVIIGAGLSGVGAAARLRMEHPNLKVVLLEMRQAIGGTWDLFRYPGIRSDSDMLTMGYRWRPWRGGAALAAGQSILDYVRATAAQYAVDEKIRFGHRVSRVAWDSASARWTVECETAHGPETITGSFLWSCTGYYDYRGGYRPEFRDEAAFRGPVVHPQAWPQGLVCEGKRVAVIGSGATAVTLVPALAKTAAHVTMVQRSPTYIVSQPDRDAFALLANRLLPARTAYAAARAKNIAMGAAGYKLSRRFPRLVSRVLVSRMRAQLPEDFDVGTHFTPKYDPWDQRICLVPNGDLFRVIREGSVSVVTGEIEAFTADGITMTSGETVAADLIVTATGLRLLAFGGIELVVDGRRVDIPNTMTYRAMMLADVPNFFFTIGYTNASWTLKADLVADFVCRLLAKRSAGQFRSVKPARDPEMPQAPLLTFTSGYVVRALDLLPKQGLREPWRLSQSYRHDSRMLRRAPIEDGVLVFD